MSKKPLFFITIFISFILGTLLSAKADFKNNYVNFRFGQIYEVRGLEGFTGSATRIVVETSIAPETRIFLLENPYRLVIDTANTEWNVPNLKHSGSITFGPVSSYRYGKPDSNTGRLVFELSEPAAPVAAFLLPPEDAGYRIVVDILDRGETAFSIAKEALRKTPYLANNEIDLIIQNQIYDKDYTNISDETEEAQSIQLSGRVVELISPLKRPKRWVVTIDPGHGGKDPGAIGLSGTKEKKITFNASRRLAEHLNNTGQVIARLTREDDSFIKLRDRIAIARKHQADLFVSIHADAAPNANAYGISVFSLSDKASDKEAELIAERENKADLLGGLDLAAQDPQAANALLGMFQRESMNESTYLAKAILEQVRSFPGGDKRGHRFAGFAVLKSPDIPSVLIEMGFLTNKQDEANLNKNKYIDKLTKKIADAILKYLNSSQL